MLLSSTKPSKSKIITRKTKIKIYKTIILPVIITHGSETWVLTKQYKKKLMILEK